METIKQRLGRDEILKVAAVGRIVHHNLVQMIGVHGGFQAIWFDQEHMDYPDGKARNRDPRLPQPGDGQFRPPGADRLCRRHPGPRSRCRGSHGRPGSLGGRGRAVRQMGQILPSWLPGLEYGRLGRPVCHDSRRKICRTVQSRVVRRHSDRDGRGPGEWTRLPPSTESIWCFWGPPT